MTSVSKITDIVGLNEDDIYQYVKGGIDLNPKEQTTYKVIINNTGCLKVYTNKGTIAKPEVSEKTKVNDIQISIKLGVYKGHITKDETKGTMGMGKKPYEVYFAFENVHDNTEYLLIKESDIVKIEEDTSSSSSSGSSVVANSTTGTGTTSSATTPNNYTVITEFETAVNNLEKSINLFNKAIENVTTFNVSVNNSETTEIEINNEGDVNTEEIVIDKSGKYTTLTYLQGKKSAIDNALVSVKETKKNVDNITSPTTEETAQINKLTNKFDLENAKIQPLIDTANPLLSKNLSGGKRRTARKGGASKKRVSKKDKKTRKAKRAGRKA